MKKLPIATLLAFSPAAFAATLVDEDFDALATDTLPAGWATFNNEQNPAAMTNQPIITTTTGTDGADGPAGQSLNIFTSAFGDNATPGAWANLGVGASYAENWTLDYDFLIPNEGSFSDAVVLIGDISNSAGKYYYITNTPTNNNVDFWVVPNRDSPGGKSETVDNFGSGFAVNEWYNATISFTATTGGAGTLTYSVTRQDGTGSSIGFGPTAITLTGDSGVEIGLGSVNDQIRIDNLLFTGTALPEPSSGLLLGLGSLFFAVRRRGKDS